MSAEPLTPDPRLMQTLERMRLSFEERDAARIVQLPLWPEGVRGTPNAFLRSALFPAIQGKDRKALKVSTLIATQRDIAIRFTGWQFDQSDLDVWEQAAHLARTHPLGSECDFTAYGFLKALGRNTGKSDHKWLHDSFIRLKAGAVEIQHGPKSYAGSLIHEVFRDEDSGRYRLVLNRGLLSLFEAGYTHIAWSTRYQLRRKPLALWLSAYYSSHEQPYPVKVATLRQLSGSGATVNKFRENLRKALDELVKVQALGGWTIEAGDKVHVKRAERPAALPAPEATHGIRGEGTASEGTTSRAARRP